MHTLVDLDLIKDTMVALEMAHTAHKMNGATGHMKECVTLHGKFKAAFDNHKTTCTHCRPYRDACRELVLPLCRCGVSNSKIVGA